jgi:serine/threonine protein kinase
LIECSPGHLPLVLVRLSFGKCVFGIAFGMSRFHSRGGIHRNRARHLSGLTFGKILTDKPNKSTVGRPQFMAPEVIAFYDDEDVYSYAVLIGNLLGQPTTLDDSPTPFRGPGFVRPNEMPDSL